MENTQEISGIRPPVAGSGKKIPKFSGI